MSRVGETVSIEFNSTDATTAAKVTLKNADFATRTLATYERLLVDQLQGNVVSAVGGVDVFADINADGNVDAGERIASFSTAANRFTASPEGTSIPVGVTPSVKAASAGAVTINGSGRIVIGKSQGQSQTWKPDLKTTGSEG